LKTLTFKFTRSLSLSVSNSVTQFSSLFDRSWIRSSKWRVEEKRSMTRIGRGLPELKWGWILIPNCPSLPARRMYKIYLMSVVDDCDEVLPCHYRCEAGTSHGVCVLSSLELGIGGFTASDPICPKCVGVLSGFSHLVSPGACQQSWLFNPSIVLLPPLV